MKKKKRVFSTDELEDRLSQPSADEKEYAAILHETERWLVECCRGNEHRAFKLLLCEYAELLDLVNKSEAI